MQPSATTRSAGLCYLAVIAGGVFAEAIVRQSLVVPGDALATATAIRASESLWRWGLAVHLAYLVPALAVNVLVASLFQAFAPLLARLALVFGACAVTIEAASLPHLYTPLAVFEDGSGTPAGDAQRILVATRLFAAGFGVSLLLFAGFCAVIGALILASRRLPGWIGALMLVAAACYAVNTLALIVAPAVHATINPAILLPIPVAEGSLALWLLFKGVAPARPARGGLPR